MLLNMFDQMNKGQAMNFAGGFPMFLVPQEAQPNPGNPGMKCRRGPPRSCGKGQRCNGPCNKSQKQQTPVDFQVTIDVSSFKPEEISVKVKDQQVIIEGKHEEREDEQGFVTRKFSRRYVLPVEIDLDTVSTYLNAQGMMTIKATKPIPPAVESNERSIPIQFLSMSDDEAEKETKVPAEQK